VTSLSAASEGSAPGRDSKARLAERERDVAAREAVVEERARIARELHDAVAHSVSMMVIQAGAERRVLGDAEASTREVLQTIEQIGRGALTEMRRLLGVLREDAAVEIADRRPQPGLAQLTTLLDESRAASGGGVRLIVSGLIAPLDPGVELAAYRIVQEALTNARRHAPGAAVDVELRYADDALRLLADQMVELEIVESISPETVRQTLKKMA